MARVKSKIKLYYAPTTAAEDNKKYVLYTQAKSTFKTTRKEDLVKGDFNAKIGDNKTNIGFTIATHGYGAKNNNFDLLIELHQT